MIMPELTEYPDDSPKKPGLTEYQKHLRAVALGELFDELGERKSVMSVPIGFGKVGKSAPMVVLKDCP